MVTNKIKIILNGKESEIEQGTTLSKLLEEMKKAPQMVACEVNQKIVRRSEYGNIVVSEGDQIEVLQMVAGG